MAGPGHVLALPTAPGYLPPRTRKAISYQLLNGGDAPFSFLCDGQSSETLLAERRKQDCNEPHRGSTQRDSSERKEAGPNRAERVTFGTPRIEMKKHAPS